MKMITTITKRELSSFFTGPIAYIVMAVFLAVSGFFFFKDFFFFKQATMRNFFQLLPVMLTFVVPAITMRLFAEERHSGSLEMLLTLPVTVSQVVAGKFFAALIFVAAMLAPTLFYLVSVILLGSPDPGPIVGGYLGALLLGGAYAAVGLFFSSLSRNQITAFIGALSVTFMLWLIDKVVIFIPSGLSFLQQLGADFHFQNIARGIIDGRDVAYFITVTVLALMGTVRILETRR